MLRSFTAGVCLSLLVLCVVAYTCHLREIRLPYDDINLLVWPERVSGRTLTHPPCQGVSC